MPVAVAVQRVAGVFLIATGAPAGWSLEPAAGAEGLLRRAHLRARGQAGRLPYRVAGVDFQNEDDHPGAVAGVRVRDVCCRRRISRSAHRRSSGEMAFGWRTWMAPTRGRWPMGERADLSPSGALLAYNTVQPDVAAKTPQRSRWWIWAPGRRRFLTISRATIAWRRSGRLMGRSCCSRFITRPSEMRIGIIDADGSGFTDVPGREEVPGSIGGRRGGPDGKSIFGEDMEKLYQLGLDGTVC